MANILKMYIIFAIYFNSWRFFFPISMDNNDYPLELRVIRDFVYILFVIFFLIRIIRTKQLKLYSSVQTNMLLCSLLFYFLSTFPSLFVIDPVEYIQHVLRNTFCYVIMLFAVRYIDGKFLENLIDSLFTNLLIAGLIGVVILFLFPEYTYENSLVFSTFANKNDFGYLMNFSFLYYFFMFFQSGRKNAGIASCISAVAILASGSTIAIVSLFISIVGISVYILLMSRSIWSKVYVTIGLVVIFTIGYALIFTQEFGFQLDVFGKLERVTESSYGPYTSYYGRIEQFNFIVDWFNDANILEILVGAFDRSEYERFDSQYYNQLYNHGLINFLLLLIFLLIELYIAIKNIKIISKDKYKAFLKATSVMLILSLLFYFPVTAYLNRFPINFVFYLVCGIVLYINENAYSLRSDNIASSNLVSTEMKLIETDNVK